MPGRHQKTDGRPGVGAEPQMDIRGDEASAVGKLFYSLFILFMPVNRFWQIRFSLRYIAEPVDDTSTKSG